MSAAAAAKLRQINEHTKLNKEANAVLVKWFDEQPKTVELLMDLTHLIRPADVLNIRKRAVKCLAMLTRGEQCGQRVGARPWAVRALAVGDHVPGIEEPAQDPVRTRFGDVGLAGDLAEAVRPARLAHRFEHTQGP